MTIDQELNSVTPFRLRAGDDPLKIFLHPQASGLTVQETFFPMSLCVPMINIPVCELGFDLEADEASENAKT